MATRTLLDQDRLAAAAMEQWQEFEVALSDKRKYPLQLFRSAAEATRRYIDLTKQDRLIDRRVAGQLHTLGDYLRVERKRVPGEVLNEVERLQCLLFSGYDPHFEGDEPPGL